MKKTLLIGYGNSLRADDGVGPLIAAEVAGSGRNNVRALAVPQLVPELAEAISDVDRVIFVDARAGRGGLSIEPLQPCQQLDDLAHFADPKGLLGLTKAIYGAEPRAWIVAVPAERFDYGEALSPLAVMGAARAMTAIEELLQLDECPVRKVRHESREGSSRGAERRRNHRFLRSSAGRALIWTGAPFDCRRTCVCRVRPTPWYPCAQRPVGFLAFGTSSST